MDKLPPTLHSRRPPYQYGTHPGMKSPTPLDFHNVLLGNVEPFESQALEHNSYRPSVHTPPISLPSLHQLSLPPSLYSRQYDDNSWGYSRELPPPVPSSTHYPTRQEDPVSESLDRQEPNSSESDVLVDEGAAQKKKRRRQALSCTGESYRQFCAGSCNTYSSLLSSLLAHVWIHWHRFCT